MKLLITGAEKGLGAKIIDVLKPEMVHNIEGQRIRNACRLGTLKDEIDFQLDNMTFKPDVVINNFGINHLSWIGETKVTDSEIMEVNAMAPYWIINNLVSRGIVCRALNVSSIAYRIPMTTTALYCASKAALEHMSRTMARELGRKGWVVNCLATGFIKDTDMATLTLEQITELRRSGPNTESLKQMLNVIPMGRFTTRIECAQMVKSIIEMPAYTNGATFEMAGGA